MRVIRHKGRAKWKEDATSCKTPAVAAIAQEASREKKKEDERKIVPESFPEKRPGKLVAAPGRECEPPAGHSYARHTDQPRRPDEAGRGVNRKTQARAPATRREDFQEEEEKDGALIMPNRSPALGRQVSCPVFFLFITGQKSLAGRFFPAEETEGDAQRSTCLST